MSQNPENRQETGVFARDWGKNTWDTVKLCGKNTCNMVNLWRNSREVVEFEWDCYPETPRCPGKCSGDARGKEESSSHCRGDKVTSKWRLSGGISCGKCVGFVGNMGVKAERKRKDSGLLPEGFVRERKEETHRLCVAAPHFVRGQERGTAMA